MDACPAAALRAHADRRKRAGRSACAAALHVAALQTRTATASTGGLACVNSGGGVELLCLVYVGL